MLFSMNDWEDLVNDNLKTKEEEKLEILLFFFFTLCMCVQYMGGRRKRGRSFLTGLKNCKRKKEKKK